MNFCGLHLLAGFTKTAEKVIFKYKQANNNKLLDVGALPATTHFTKRSELGVARTVRIIAKVSARVLMI